MFSCKRWTSTNFVRSELTVETLAFSKHGEIILRSMSQTKEKCDFLVLSRSDLWMVWRCHGITRVFYYLFRTKGKKGNLNENDFRHRCGNFFQKGILKVIWSQLCSKFLLNNYEAHWHQHYEKYPIVEYFTAMDQHTC